MQTTKKRAFVALSIVALVLIAWLVKLYFVADHAGATTFQRGDEAYLFVGTGHTGWHFSALLFPVVMAKGYFHVPAEASDQFEQSLVIRVAPQGVQRWLNGTADISLLTPLENGFYARCPGTVLCKWTEKGFVRGDPEEEKQIPIENLYSGSLDNKVINGWTAHQLKFAPGDHLEIQLGQGLAIAARNLSEKDSAYPNISVDLLRSGQAPESLYRADARPRLVSRANYERLLEKR